MMDFNSLREMYSEKNVFSNLNIDLLIQPTIFDDNPIYVLSKVELGELDTEDRNIWENLDLTPFIEKLNEDVKHFNVHEQYSLTHKSWSVFYAFKEIIDCIENYLPDKFNGYYRGQNGSWELEPSIFRDNYSSDFRNNFEEIYHNIARKYPTFVQYYSRNENLEKRVNNLAELQHYGIGTPLVDITRNPFIAMLFMVDGYEGIVQDSNHFPQMEVFFVKENGENILFNQVEKTSTNLRIDVQQGAFLNFEKLENNNSLLHPNGAKKIPKIKIRLILENETSEDTKSILSNIDNEENNNDTKAIVPGTGYTVEECALLTAVKDIEKKLKSYFYNTDDLFPDFYMYLKHLKSQYKPQGKKASSDDWYKLQES